MDFITHFLEFAACINSLLPIYIPTWLTLPLSIVSKNTKSPGCKSSLETACPTLLWSSDTLGISLPNAFL